MNPKEIHDLEQGAQTLKEHFCPIVFSVYEGFVAAGFSSTQALELTQTWMMPTMGPRR